MIREIHDIQQSPRNIILLWDGNYPQPATLRQIQICLKSIILNEPGAQIHLFSNVLKEDDLPHEHVALVRWDYQSLGYGTVLDGILPQAGSDWRLWSDLFRVVALWRWGGTYFDVDDIMVRPLPRMENLIAACFLTKDQYDRWTPGPVIPGAYAASTGSLAPSIQFRFGNDPLTNFKPRNAFLEKWMARMPQSAVDSWGQTLPTQIFSADPAWARRHLNLVPWSDLLYHPYDGGHHPEDQRYSGNSISTHLRLKEQDYPGCWKKLLGSHGFYLVKNHDFSLHVRSGDEQEFLKWIVQDLWRRIGGKNESFPAQP